VQVMRTPKSMDLEITTRCNLRCEYCSHFTSAGDVGLDLPKEEWLRFFEELNQCAVMEVQLSGGEPFLRKDLKDLIEGIVRNRMRFSMLSNGILISEEMAAFLASTGRCNHVQVSIDGATPATHDSFRGKGSFLKAIDGIRNLLKYKVPVTVRVTIHRQNVRDLEAIAAYLLEDMGLPGFSTNAASPMGLCLGDTGRIQLNVEEQTLAMEKLLALTRKYEGRINAQAGPLAQARDWQMMEQARREGKDPIPGRGYLTGCGGPMSQIAVRADGVFVPCCQIPHAELGRINRDNLRDVWQDHPELKKMRERNLIPLNSFEFCRGCDYLNYCTGSCPALAYNAVKDLYHPSPSDCFRRFLEEGGSLPDLTPPP
jgi:SynChlorMet cassette radical SAM/SPASM protein ScmE